MNKYEIRQDEQAKRKAFKAAAKRLHPELVISGQANVAMDVDGEGAFVEAVTWIRVDQLTEEDYK